MESFKILKNRARYIFAAIGLVSLVVVAPFASAAQVTARSITLSSSTKAATGVSYQLNFTSVGAGGGLVLDFCSDTPLVGQTCTSPGGFSVSAATTATAGWTRTLVDANTIKLVGTIGAASAISVTVDAVTNPSAAGPLYARIVTYAASGDLANYVSATNLGANTVDTGSVALSITDNIGVTGDVLETMTFCVSKSVDITAGCGGSLDAPTLEIGELTGSVRALSSTALSTVGVLTQISTNADGGAVVSLKSSTTTCGGLSRLGAPSIAAGCGVPAQNSMTDSVVQGTAGIGIKGATATDEGTATGSYVLDSDYDTTEYRLGYASDNLTGVTSTYGDQLLNTAGDPVSNKEMTLTFGASISPNTPAGRYTANYSLIATGTF